MIVSEKRPKSKAADPRSGFQTQLITLHPKILTTVAATAKPPAARSDAPLLDEACCEAVAAEAAVRRVA